MSEIRFSSHNTGACPQCGNRNDCHILLEATKALTSIVSSKNDKIMELVIYRCPEFELK